MKIIGKKKQNEIAKRLAAMYYTAIHWHNEDTDLSNVKCIVENAAEIAYAVGGERMMAIDVPALVECLNSRLGGAADA